MENLSDARIASIGVLLKYADTMCVKSIHAHRFLRHKANGFVLMVNVKKLK